MLVSLLVPSPLFAFAAVLRRLLVFRLLGRGRRDRGARLESAGTNAKGNIIYAGGLCGEDEAFIHLLAAST